MIAVDDLIITKVLAGRPKDIGDVRALWAAHGTQLDASRIRNTFRRPRLLRQFRQGSKPLLD